MLLMLTASAPERRGLRAAKEDRKPSGVSLPRSRGASLVRLVELDVLNFDVLRQLIDSLGDRDGSEERCLHERER